MKTMREKFEEFPEIARNGRQRIVFGFGISDALTSIGGKKTKEYIHWAGMIRRCYSESRYDISDNYLDCCVSKEFQYFSRFKEWCCSQIGYGNDGWQIDKDLLCKGNKVYSPDNCCFLPREINSVLITQKKRRGDLPIGVGINKRTGNYIARVNVKCKMKNLGTRSTIQEAFDLYKDGKERIIKNMAREYKGLICDRAYEALMNYEVLITD